MCGIIAFAGSNVKSFNKDKFNILGILNETRGKHSCGVALDGEVYKGVDGFKVFRDFAAYSDYGVPVQHPTVIGHTRHATGGAHNLDNTHPFSFKHHSQDEVNAFIGVHNGSLHNELELAEEFGVDSSVESTRVNSVTKNTTTVFRNKIDSEILLEIIFKTGKYDVLSKYNGAAALVWYNPSEPNVMYCYHGKSKKNTYDTQATEERPLFYCEIDGGTYISSIHDSLLVIGGDIEDIHAFEHNKVYKITNGDVLNAEKTSVDRSDSFIAAQYRSKQPKPSCGLGLGQSDKKQLRLPVDSVNSNLLNIFCEEPTFNVNSLKGKIYFNKLRYWRNGHLANGVFTFIRGYGYYHLGYDIPSATTRFKELLNKEFVLPEGYFSLTKTSVGAFIPFKTDMTRGDDKDLVNPPFEYIYEGVALKTRLDFSQLQNASVYINTKILSHASKHPIVNVNTYKRANSQNIYHDGVLYTGRFTVLGSEKLYNIKGGNLVGINDTQSNFSAIGGKSVSTDTTLQKELSKIVADEIKSSSASSHSDSDIKLVQEVSTSMTKLIKDLPDLIAYVEEFVDSEIKTDVLNTLDGMLWLTEDLNTILTSKKKNLTK